MEAATHVGRQRVQELAQEYRSKGYEVITEPLPEQLPDFLCQYRPDLLVRKGSESIIVEVKTRSSLAGNPQIRDLARVLHATPDWKFELVTVREKEKLDTPEGACPLARADIPSRLETVEGLLEIGSPEAAFLLGWAALEATVRLLVEEEQLTLDRIAPSYLLRQAVTNGVVSREDYELLLRAMKYRNALVHGLKIADFDTDFVREFVNTTKHLLEETSGASSEGAESSRP